MKITKSKKIKKISKSKNYNASTIANFSKFWEFYK